MNCDIDVYNYRMGHNKSFVGELLKPQNLIKALINGKFKFQSLSLHTLIIIFIF
jgi:hypothetical protein